jgi:type IX secretion system PorP/SprF family membrane protein
MRKTLLFISLGISLSLSAQDYHFSQFWSAPLNINPASAGVHGGDIRVISNYRTQWAAVSPEPYKTIGASFDMMIPPRKAARDFWGIGVNFNNDKAGVGNLRTTQGNLSLSYSKPLSRNSNLISLGVQIGGGSRAIDYSGFSWDAQYNGVAYDPALSTNEPLAAGISTSYLDFSGGVLWSFCPTKNFRLNSGLSLYHINRPELSFTGAKDAQSMRLTYHGSAQIISKKFSGTSVIPAVLYMQQGPQRLLNAGLGVRYRLQDRSKYTGYESETAIYVGAFYRLQDAAYIVMRLDYGDFGFGVSYDLNVSNLTVASNGRGGLELMLIFNKSLFHNNRNNPKLPLRFVNL